MTSSITIESVVGVAGEGPRLTEDAVERPARGMEARARVLVLEALFDGLPRLVEDDRKQT